MYPNEKISEHNVRIDDHSIQPISENAGTVTTGWIDTSLWDRFSAEVNTGVMQATSTVDAKLQQAQDSSGTGAKDITGKAITQLTQAGGKSGTSSTIDCRADELDVNGGFRYVRLSITVGTAASLISGSVRGDVPKYAPASDHASTKVNEFVN